MDAFFRDPHTMAAADTGCVKIGVSEPNPRCLGNNARAIEYYVVEKKELTLEEVIRKMTWLPAESFGIRDRGKIAKGFAADIVVFEEAKVKAKATLEDPNHYASGFQHVLVNGVEIVRDDELLAARPGEIVRYKP
jgi:N-acyl-D-amino-acid deacylase